MKSGRNDLRSLPTRNTRINYHKLIPFVGTSGCASGVVALLIWFSFAENS